MKLLDTDTCIGILRGYVGVLDRRQAEREELVTSWVTASELFFGAARSSRPEENAAALVLSARAQIGLSLQPSDEAAGSASSATQPAAARSEPVRIPRRPSDRI